MAEEEFSYQKGRSISVPFCWEEIPGTPKHNWKPPTPQKKPFTPPAKFNITIPFKWEEKPGKPLPSFSQPLPTSTPALPPAESTLYFLSSPTHSPVNGTYWGHISDQDGDETRILDTNSHSWESTIDDSFSLAPILATSFRATTALPKAVIMQAQSMEAVRTAEKERPASPSSVSDSSSYATGESLLEWLFPLLSPHSSYREKLGCWENGLYENQAMNEIDDFSHEKKYAAKITSPPTLGELIMMSRRRSYQRKAMEMRAQRLTKANKMRNTLGCCIHGPVGVLSKLHINWTRQLQFKLR